MIVVLIGPPGAGKSQQSRLLKEREHIEWISVGKLLRAQNNPKFDQMMNEGQLVDDNEVNAVVASHIETIPKQQVVVLDGTPRHLAQAEWLINYSHQSHHELKRVIVLDVPPEVSRERLAQRGRPDDNPESINKRLDEHTATITPIIDYFKREDVPVSVVDGNRPVETVFKDLDDLIYDVHQS